MKYLPCKYAFVGKGEFSREASWGWKYCFADCGCLEQNLLLARAHSHCMSSTHQLAFASLVSTCLRRVPLCFRILSSSARRGNWRLMLAGCRMKPKRQCRGVKMQKRRPRRQPLRWVHWLLAHSCLPELTRAVAKGQGQICSQKEFHWFSIQPGGD